jgi:hypothetical protein
VRHRQRSRARSILVNDIFGGDRYAQWNKPPWEHDLAGKRIVKDLTFELADHPVTALGVTPGWLRSEQMLENLGVSEENGSVALSDRK